MIESWRWPRHLRPVARTEGHLTRAEAETLYQLAARVSDGCIVEIGSFRGRSTVALALGSRTNREHPMVYAIDPHAPFTGALGGQFGPHDRRAFFANLLRAGVAEDVSLINLPAAQVSQSWEQPVSLLWIDGDHRYEAVRADVDGWLPHLVPSAALAFHDSIDPQEGPRRVIAELLGTGYWREAKASDSLSVLERI